jgi:hypothetical protein
MTKGEKRFDKIMAIFFTMIFWSVFFIGVIKLSEKVSPVAIEKKKEKQDSLQFECVHCGWMNKRSLFDIMDTTKIDSLLWKK